MEKARSLPCVRIIYVWVVVFIAIIFYAFAWFSIGSVGMAFINACLQSFDFGSPWSTVVDIIKMVILWHPIISLFGWILWGILNSMKRDTKTWEIAD